MNYTEKKGVTLQRRKDDDRGNFVAEIGISGKDKKTKNFSIKKYGKDKAARMALYQRLAFEVERNKKSDDYEHFCYEFMKEIADFYNYDINKDINGVITVNDDESAFIYDSIDKALIDWYETLNESDKCSINEKVDMYWEEERKFIKTLIDYNK